MNSTLSKVHREFKGILGYMSSFFERKKKTAREEEEELEEEIKKKWFAGKRLVYCEGCP